MGKKMMDNKSTLLGLFWEKLQVNMKSICRLEKLEF